MIDVFGVLAGIIWPWGAMRVYHAETLFERLNVIAQNILPTVSIGGLQGFSKVPFCISFAAFVITLRVHHSRAEALLTRDDEQRLVSFDRETKSHRNSESLVQKEFASIRRAVGMRSEAQIEQLVRNHLKLKSLFRSLNRALNDAARTPVALDARLCEQAPSDSSPLRDLTDKEIRDYFLSEDALGLARMLDERRDEFVPENREASRRRLEAELRTEADKRKRKDGENLGLVAGLAAGLAVCALRKAVRLYVERR